MAETREEEQIRLIDLGTSGLHTLHHGFQHGKKASGWELKSLLNAMYKIFDESPERRADYEKIMTTIESDFALQFCSHRGNENARVAERAENIWEKYLQIIDFWKTLPKSKQLGQGKPGSNKSYDTLLKKASDLLVPVKLKFFKEVAGCLNSFLVTFQTDTPMIPLLVDKLEEILRFYCWRFILPVMMEKANSTLKLSLIFLCQHLLARCRSRVCNH